jgi:hypothetical protein
MTTTTVTIPAPRTPEVDTVTTSCGHPATDSTATHCAADPWDLPHCDDCHHVGHCGDCTAADTATYDDSWEH